MQTYFQPDFTGGYLQRHCRQMVEAPGLEPGSTIPFIELDVRGTISTPAAPLTGDCQSLLTPNSWLDKYIIAYFKLFVNSIRHNMIIVEN